ncbi:Lrp/AsnC family transcriptional regulator [Candidatus Pacearchaeota archaeon]|nr:Lrp/AsnC family transcriptional regulator [Candidatus Pacearchaeota archaeon]
MDLIDKKVLCALDTNSREPLSKIAKRLRISRNTLAYRIKSLEDKGIISKYITTLNLGKLGFRTYKVHFRTRLDKMVEKEFVKYMIENKNVIYFLKTEGAFDFSASLAVKNIKELDEILMNIKSKFSKIIKDYFVSIVVFAQVFKLDKLLLDANQEIKRFEHYSGEDKVRDIDDKDIKILNELSQKSNMSIVELSSKTKLSIDVVKYRLKNLSESVINSFRPLFDLSKIGYHLYSVMLKMNTFTKRDEQSITTWLAHKKNVMYYTKRIGNYELIINTVIKDVTDLNSFVKELREKFGDIIENYDTLIISKILKLDYVVL